MAGRRRALASRNFFGLDRGAGIDILPAMKTFRLAMLGLGVAALCLAGCAERPGQKKDDKKADGEKADAKKDAKKAEAKE
jgi:hypothetical protein